VELAGLLSTPDSNRGTQEVLTRFFSALAAITACRALTFFAEDLALPHPTCERAA
jgi:hypothetical protein